jgi:hypothetical protein
MTSHHTNLWRWRNDNNCTRQDCEEVEIGAAVNRRSIAVRKAVFWDAVLCVLPPRSGCNIPQVIFILVAMTTWKLVHYQQPPLDSIPSQHTSHPTFLILYPMDVCISEAISPVEFFGSKFCMHVLFPAWALSSPLNFLDLIYLKWSEEYRFWRVQ